MLYQINKGSVSLGGEQILDHIDFEVKGKEKIAVVGKNGAGKTTLLKLIAGKLALDRDDKRFSPGIIQRGSITIGMLSQNVLADLERTLRQEMMESCPHEDPFSKERFEYERMCRRHLSALGFHPEDWDRKLAHFSGGEQTRIALVCLLIRKTDLLLLDEPTNHLDFLALSWLEDQLQEYPGAVVMVSHDRYFLDHVADTVYELEDGRLSRYAGNYTAYRIQKQKDREIRKKRYNAMVDERKRLEETIRRFAHKPRKAAMARAKKKQLARMEVIDPPKKEDMHLFTKKIEPERPGPKTVLEAEKVVFGYDKPLGILDCLIRRGRKVGILGENGVGKSAMLKTMAGRLEKLGGKIRIGQGVSFGYFDQMTSRISYNWSVYDDWKKHFPLWEEEKLRKTMASYLFGGADAYKKVSDLSGGEKSRLILGQILEQRPNLLMLDEPTNHMDIPAKETLESAWKAYTGTMLFITHDRYFLHEVADSLLVFSKENITFYPFGYDHYDQMMRKEEKDIRDAVLMENVRLTEGLMAVPKKEKHQSTPLNTEQAFTDWQLSLAREEMERCRMICIDRQGQYQDYASWLSDVSLLTKDQISSYHESCLLWYEKYLDYEEAFAHYHE